MGGSEVMVGPCGTLVFWDGFLMGCENCDDFSWYPVLSGVHMAKICQNAVFWGSQTMSKYLTAHFMYTL